ncbi:MAG: ATP-binding protein [Endomicrobiales bacterium]|jgi:signal transduction histidine kinase/HAMP domain-containing protein
MKLKLFPKFILILSLISVIPATIVGLRTIAINKEGMQAAILELHTHLASSLSETVDSSLATMERETQFIARTLSTGMAWTDRQSVLQSLLDADDNFVSISIVNRSGQELIKAYNPTLEKNPVLTDLHSDPVFLDFLKNPTTINRSSVYEEAGHPRMNLLFPLTAEHCLYAVISLESLWNKISTTRIGSTGFAFLVDSTGMMITHPDHSVSGSSQSTGKLPIVKQALSAMTVGSCEYRRPDGVTIVGAYAPVKRLHWGLIIQQDKQEAYISVRRMQEQAGLLIVLSVGIACLLAVFIARSLAKPITALTTAASQVARKDFTTRVEVNTHDELHDLAETFNAMTTELERYDRLQVDAIIEEKTKTEAVIFSITDGILMMDCQGRIQVANTHAKELLNLPETQWQNSSPRDFIKNSNLRDAFEDIIQDPLKNTQREVMVSQQGLNRYYMLSTGQVVTTGSTEKIGLVTTLRDITLEKELDNIKEEFLHSITHDLRNPMTSIMGFLRFMLDEVAGPISPQQKKMLETMDRASHRLLGLINDILDIAKMESGTLVLSLAESDVKSLASRNVEILEAIALRRSITMSIDCPDDLPKIVVDGELIERVFGNLINNALKFTPEQGRVTVAIRALPDHFLCSVTDTGEGIPPDYLDKIFNKFQQVSGQHKGGTGLGLTICKHIVEAHKGTICVESKLGEGSTFKFTIPRGLTTTIVGGPAK